MLVIPIFVPHAGCPHNCCFCNQKIISGQSLIPTTDDVIKTIDLFRPAAERYSQVQIAFYGGSFTAIEEELQIMFLETVRPYLKENGGFVDLLRLSTRPDCINDDVLLRLKRYGVKVVELGAQSMDDTVLMASRRGHLASDTEKAVELLKNYDFTVGIQTMTGLPLSSRESDLATARKVCKLKPDFVRIYPTVVVKGTALHISYLAGGYVPQSTDEAVELCAELLAMYKEQDISVARIGLQSSDTISTDGEVAAGPYHAAFGQLVHSLTILKRIEAILDESYSFVNVRDKFTKYELVLFCETKNISDCVGQKRVNVNKLQQKYGFKSIKVRDKADADKFMSYHGVILYEEQHRICIVL